MRSAYPKLFIILIIWWALALSLFFRREVGSLSSSILWPAPSISEPPKTTTSDVSWYTWSWSSCVSGKRTRIVECRESSGTRVADSTCWSPKPATEEVYAISWPKHLIAQETVWPVIYKVQLSKPNNSDAKITAVTIDAIPKNRPAVNATHPQDWTGKSNPWMTWTRKEIGPNFAILETMDHAWYGVPGGTWNPQLCHDSNTQSIYTLLVIVQLDNGCVLETSSDMSVKGETIIPGASRGGYTNISTIKTRVSVMPSLSRSLQSNSGIVDNTPRVFYQACIDLDGTVFRFLGFSIVAEKWQYSKYIREEEEFHQKQFTGQVPWSQGWLVWVDDAFKIYFKKRRPCVQNTNPKQADDDVRTEVSKRIDLVSAQYFGWGDHKMSDVHVPGTTSNNSRCWIELNAKKAAWLTENVGSGFLECTYKGYGCRNNMKQPADPVEIIRDM